MSTRSGGGDVKSDWAWVGVLKVVQARVPHRADPEADSFPGRTAIWARSEVDGGAWLDGERSEVVRHLGGSGVGGSSGCNSFENGDLKLAGATELVCRSLELVSSWEQELEGACHAWNDA